MEKKTENKSGAFETIVAEENNNVEAASLLRIDTHTHIFNARALPVEGFVWHMIGANVGQLRYLRYLPPIRVLVKSIIKLVNASLRTNKIKAEKEIKELEGLLEGPSLLSAVDALFENLRNDPEGLTEEEESQFIKSLNDSLELNSPATLEVYEFLQYLEFEVNQLDAEETSHLIESIETIYGVSSISVRDFGHKLLPAESSDSIAKLALRYQGWSSILDQDALRGALVIGKSELNSRSIESKKFLGPISFVGKFLTRLFLKGIGFKAPVKAATSTHLKNMTRLLKHYGNKKNPSGAIDQFIVAPVDMNYWVGHESHKDDTDLSEQYKIVSLIAEVFPERLIPFAAYDPWRQLEDVYKNKNVTALELVKKVVEKDGFRGVKLYPQMGFRPFGNTAIDRLNDWPKRARKFSKKAWGDKKQFGRHLDEALIEFFTWAAINKVPIMAHGNPSLGANVGYENRGSAVFWRSLLEYKLANGTRPFENLQVNLGHFGGIDNIVSGDDWTLSIINLISDFEHVYADLSNYDDISKRSYRKMLADALNDQIRLGNKSILKKLMYGSDWWMLYSDDDWKKYTKNMDKMLSMLDLTANEIAVVKKDFFGGNAMRFLG